MEKKIYYVTVDIGSQTGEIRHQLETNDAYYDFEIFATEEEVEKLEKLFWKTQDTDFLTFVVSHVPFLDNERKENTKEDQQIDQIYRMIHQLGTEQTKKQIEDADLLKS